MEAPYKRLKHGTTQIFHREVGLSPPRNFTRRFSASELMVEKLNLYGKLLGHDSCVNAIEFNSAGNLLVSGSDDMQVMVWDWGTKTKRVSYHSGHYDNIFQARIMPFSDDQRIVTSSADGQVRLGQLSENGTVYTKRLGKHLGRVYKLAVEPGSPYIFYSCSEDGFVNHFDMRTDSSTKLFYCTVLADSKRHLNTIKLNAIEIDSRNPNYFAVGGSDEYARVYDIRKCQWNASCQADVPVNTFCPRHLMGNESVHITGLAYSNMSELLLTYNDELIYVFQKNMGMGPSPVSIQPEDLQKMEDPQVYMGHRNSQTIKGVNFFGPNHEYVMSGSDCGHIFIWKKQGAKLVRVMLGDQDVVNQLEPHPHLPIFATCGIEKSVKLWTPIASEAPPLPGNIEKIMESNKQGREAQPLLTLGPDVIMHLLRMQRRQSLAYIERRYGRDDVESDEDERGAHGSGFSGVDASSDEGSRENPSDCNVN
ncbi:hypothetical protein K2173_023637 [Erythroxylum novogranatense]|uniref:Uncharacterized protein n=1 Tax=Erythroxylum novogranatense TaxID=1862640 RepID=A0AAV8TPL8_9ROSI|nr:hypothetical protein K2173_023637 [Erythroxylum novogranatense]